MSALSRRLGRTLAFCAIVALAAPASLAGTDYPPMKVFESAAGKTWRAEGKDEKGGKVVDISHWEFILGGKALQITHSINDGAYGGRTILFFDEGGQEYVFHYFTTAGFHSQGTAVMDGNVMTSTEKVSGHDDIVEVRATSTLGADRLTIESEYVRKNGEAVFGHNFTYTRADGAKVVFRPAQ